jgi:Fe-S cluster biosynthesis and repair protein YggX
MQKEDEVRCVGRWKEWVAMGTKVINELRLPMNEPEAQKVFDKHMYEFLNLQPPK